MREVLRHTAEVYEHKIACVELGGPAPDPWPPEWPATDPLAWFDDAHRRVLEMLRTVDPAAPSWTWWPDDQTAGFWLRRMAHETVVHRVDVELAFDAVTPVDGDLAVDGIEELLYLMFDGDWTGDEQPDLTGTIAVTTLEKTWTIRMVEDRVDVDTDDHADVAATVTAAPAAVLLWMYGRAPDDVVTVRQPSDRNPSEATASGRDPIAGRVAVPRDATSAVTYLQLPIRPPCDDRQMAMFAVTTAKGPAWNDRASIREQLAFADHATFVDDLVARGVIVLGGPIESDDPAVVALIAVQASTVDEVRDWFADDPWITRQVFVLKSVHPWTIWLDGRPGD